MRNALFLFVVGVLLLIAGCGKAQVQQPEGQQLPAGQGQSSSDQAQSGTAAQEAPAQPEQPSRESDSDLYSDGMDDSAAEIDLAY
ncbi:alpha-fetoprotein enhancer-binding protein [Candidatus Woesearchaeota archaeon]|nr:alpha-fetoprotein enhancer-binding protein [Candidatus Woesearchaeota archaeon]